MKRLDWRRRDFLRSAAGAATLAACPGALRANTPPFKTKLVKALLADVADEATCERIAAAGFPGMELKSSKVTLTEAAAGRRIAEKHGLKVHAFMGGWADFNNPDDNKRKQSIEEFKRRIRITAAYGGDTILVVPCRINCPCPKPTQFKLDYDPRTLHLKQVVAGDNTPFATYIAEHNRSSDLTIAAVKELIPVALECKVNIALENVWNNLWVLPQFATDFIKSFQHERVVAYLDLGNHVRYAPTEEWLRAMGPIIAKLHIKDFKIDRSKKNDGDFVPIGKGDIDWVSVRRVIEEVGYSGWVTIESSGYTDQEHSALMDRFFAGQGTNQ